MSPGVPALLGKGGQELSVCAGLGSRAAPLCRYRGGVKQLGRSGEGRWQELGFYLNWSLLVDSCRDLWQCQRCGRHISRVTCRGFTCARRGFQAGLRLLCTSCPLPGSVPRLWQDWGQAVGHWWDAATSPEVMETRTLCRFRGEGVVGTAAGLRPHRA